MVNDNFTKIKYITKMRVIYIYLAFFILLLSSCNNEQIINEYDRELPICFSTRCFAISTKTSETTIYSHLSETKISLFSIQHTPNKQTSQWNPSLFNNTIGITDSNGNISYGNTYYFPNNDLLDFFAIYPSLQDLNTKYTESQYIDIILEENTTKQYDLMYASLLNKSKKSSLLVFEFHHLLTQIAVNIIKAPATIINLPLTQIQLVAPQSATLDIWKGELNSIQGQTTYTLESNTILSDTETIISGQFLLFPQKASKMLLTFGNDESNIFEVSLSGDPQTWEPGVNYQYNITISRNIPESVSTETPVDNTENTIVDNTPVDNETTTDPNNVAPVTKAITPNTVMVYRSID